MKLLSGLLLVLFLTGCKDDPASPAYNSAWFPLSLGNKWTYSGSVEMIIEAVSLKEFAGKNYFCVVRYFPSASDTMYLRYNRNDHLMIFFDEKEYLFIDFTLPEGSRWDSYYSYYGQIRGKNLNSTVQAGIFSSVIEILFENTAISDIYELNRYAPGVGMISSAGFRRNFELRSAFVDGKSYP